MQSEQSPSPRLTGEEDELLQVKLEQIRQAVATLRAVKIDAVIELYRLPTLDDHDRSVVLGLAQLRNFLTSEKSDSIDYI